MSAVGFDIGNENSFIAAVKSGGIEVLDNEYNVRFTPTYVTFSETCRNVGIAAKSKVIANLENTVFGFKKLFGKLYKDPDVQEELTFLPFEVCELPSGYIGVKVNYLNNNVTFSVTQLMAMMLTKLKMITEAKFGSMIRDCVISVPVYYTDAQRRYMLDAANIAGLNALQLVNESHAIALAYGFYKQDLSEQPQNVIFVDLGNSNMTVTACAFTKEKLEILGCVWGNVGGRDFDNKLVNYFAHDFRDRYELDVLSNKKAIMRLMLECESVKKMMSANSLELGIQMECFMQDMDVKGKMKRQLFENLCAGVLNRVENTLLKILEETQLKVEDIHAVEIVGASSRIPAVKYLIKQIFGREPSATLNQDEAVARGCALRCALLSPSLKAREFIVHDKPSYTIKVVWKNKEFKEDELEVFTRRDNVPGFKKITLSMNKPFILEAFYRNSSSLKMSKIGDFRLGNIPQDVSLEIAEFFITTSYDIHGIFSVTNAKMTLRRLTNDSEKILEQNERKEDVSSEKEDVSSADKEKSDTKAVCVVYDLSVSSNAPGLSKVELDSFIKLEKEMIEICVKAREQADARNALEEYIYDARGKLSYELSDFVTEEDKSKLLELLNDTENWLGDNENLTVIEYTEKKEECDNHLEPVFSRCIEWETISSVIDECRQTLKGSFATLDALAGHEDISHFKEDAENLHTVWQEFRSYLNETIDTFAKLKKYDDFPFKSGDLRKSLNRFKNDFQKLHCEIKSKLEKLKECAPKNSSTSGQPSFGDGNQAVEDTIANG